MAEQHHTIAADVAQNSIVDIIKIITDEPSSEDALDFENYSLKLAEIIKNSTPRFSIGIFGGWDTGKTTLMLMTKKILDNDKDKKIVTVWFDAWRYERRGFSSYTIS
jgi:predicted KAP-like P-loop ATPase